MKVKDYYIFSKGESLKIEIHERELRIANSYWFETEKFVQQMQKFLDRIKDKQDGK